MKQCCKFYFNGIESNLERNDPAMASAYADTLAVHIRDEHKSPKNLTKGRL